MLAVAYNNLHCNVFFVHQNPPMSGVALAAYYAIILARVGPFATFTTVSINNLPILHYHNTES